MSTNRDRRPFERLARVIPTLRTYEESYDFGGPSPLSRAEAVLAKLDAAALELLGELHKMYLEAMPDGKEAEEYKLITAKLRWLTPELHAAPAPAEAPAVTPEQALDLVRALLASGAKLEPKRVGRPGAARGKRKTGTR